MKKSKMLLAGFLGILVGFIFLANGLYWMNQSLDCRYLYGGESLWGIIMLAINGSIFY